MNLLRTLACLVNSAFPSSHCVVPFSPYVEVLGRRLRLAVTVPVMENEALEPTETELKLALTEADTELAAELLGDAALVVALLGLASAFSTPASTLPPATGRLSLFAPINNAGELSNILHHGRGSRNKTYPI